MNLKLIVAAAAIAVLSVFGSTKADAQRYGHPRHYSRSYYHYHQRPVVRYYRRPVYRERIVVVPARPYYRGHGYYNHGYRNHYRRPYYGYAPRRHYRY